MKTDGRLQNWNIPRNIDMVNGINRPVVKKDIPRICIVCGKEFLSVSNKKDTCGINCYKRLWRKNKKNCLGVVRS